MSLVPYEEIHKDEYAEEAAQRFTFTQLGSGTAELHGPCPRCGHAIRVPVVDGVYKSFWPRRRNSAGPTPPPGNVREEDIICTCEEEHPGRQEGQFGCGAYWSLEITTS
jgi:hypothetical protein